MSGFDENPFGDPADDPFSNPPVRDPPQATVTRAVIENQVPFNQSSQVAPPVRTANPPAYGGIGATQQPATLPSTNREAAPSSFPRNFQPTQTTSSRTFSPTTPQNADPSKMGGDMQSPSFYARRNNWPPLPDKCCFQPCFYQDIDCEIHTEFQKIVRQLYYLWMFHGLVLMLNALGGFLYFITFGVFEIFGLGVLYLILFTPFSFLCWYRPVYKAFKNDSSINFMVFFFVFFFQFIVTSIQSLGVSGTGTCGIFQVKTAFGYGTGKGTFMGIIMLLVSIAYVTAAVADFLLLTKVHRMYRNTDASMQKAQQEFATTFLGNEHVQNAASNVAANAIRTQMSQAAGQPRY